MRGPIRRDEEAMVKEISRKRFEAEENVKQLISFMLGDEEYGLEILRVKEVIRTPAVTRLPNAPSFVKGIINLRGDVVPIIDLRDRFGLDRIEQTLLARVIVADIDGRLVGLVVDSVSQVVRIPADQIEAPPPVAGGLPSEIVDGVGKIGDRLIVLLNIDAILSAGEREDLDVIESDDAGSYPEDDSTETFAVS
jgi:purine-binding chemotaxis protein CheW